MIDAILVLNAGSSSLKFCVFDVEGGELRVAVRGQLDGLPDKARFVARDGAGAVLDERSLDGRTEHEGALQLLLEWTQRSHLAGRRVVAAGHRVVHGGRRFTGPERVDDRVLEALEGLVPLAPLHQPHNLAAIRLLRALAPSLPQVACFDTAFHCAQPRLARLFALPRRYLDEGVERYGFHGLSYEYVARRLRELDPRAAAGRVVIAHLGNGASLCAVRDGVSVATTMSFTALDGLPMGTRCGALDPGVLLHLMSRYGMGERQLEDLLYHESGLLGVSAISGDVRELLASADPRAAEALDLFVYRIGRELGSLAAALGGLDALVFAGGIGENAAQIRGRVCRDAAWLGLELDEDLNAAGEPRISRPASAVGAWVVPTDEERMIATHVRAVLAC
ncbi:MAG: acetate/propionate family kinase [Thermodesulfobacteriota bacterium]